MPLAIYKSGYFPLRSVDIYIKFAEFKNKKTHEESHRISLDYLRAPFICVIKLSISF